MRFSPREQYERDDLAEAVRSAPHTSRKVPVIDRLREIVATRTAARVDGVLVDLFSASVTVQVYDRLNEGNRAKLGAMPVRRMVNVCLQVVG